MFHLDATTRRRGFTCSLWGDVFTWCFTTSRFTSSLLSACHSVLKFGVAFTTHENALKISVFSVASNWMLRHSLKNRNYHITFIHEFSSKYHQSIDLNDFYSIRIDFTVGSSSFIEKTTTQFYETSNIDIWAPLFTQTAKKKKFHVKLSQTKTVIRMSFLFCFLLFLFLFLYLIIFVLFVEVKTNVWPW